MKNKLKRFVAGGAIAATLAIVMLSPAPALAWGVRHGGGWGCGPGWGWHGGWGWRGGYYVGAPAYVPAPVVVYPPPPGRYWIPGHNNIGGYWIPGHWVY